MDHLTKKTMLTSAVVAVSLVTAWGFVDAVTSWADLRAASACSGMSVADLDAIATRGAAVSNTTLGESRHFLRVLSCPPH